MKLEVETLHVFQGRYDLPPGQLNRNECMVIYLPVEGNGPKMQFR
jgi:hypothetical protein